MVLIIQAYNYDGTKNYNIAEISDFSNSNLLINGDFQVWQKGESITCKAGVKTYTADMWLFTSDSPTTIVSRFSEGGRLTFSTATNKQHVLRQFIELNKNSKALFINQKVTLTISLKSTAACSFQVGVGNQRKALSVVNGDNVLSTSFVITESDMANGFLEVLAMNLLATSSYNLSFIYAKLEFGMNETSRVPNPYVDELIRCKRYYDAFDGLNLPVYQSWVSNLRDHLIMSIPLSTEIRNTPTPTITISDCSVMDSSSGAIIAFSRLTCSFHSLRNNVLSIKIGFKEGLWSAGVIYNANIKLTIDSNTY